MDVEIDLLASAERTRRLQAPGTLQSGPRAARKQGCKRSAQPEARSRAQQALRCSLSATAGSAGWGGARRRSPEIEGVAKAIEAVAPKKESRRDSRLGARPRQPKALKRRVHAGVGMFRCRMLSCRARRSDEIDGRVGAEISRWRGQIDKRSGRVVQGVNDATTMGGASTPPDGVRRSGAWASTGHDERARITPGRRSSCDRSRRAPNIRAR